MESVLQQPLLVPEGSYREGEGEAGPPFVSAGIPAGHWPASGHVEFMGVMLRYAGQSVPVLSGLDLDVPGGSKIGICGRTGKSCLGPRHISFPAPLLKILHLQPAPSIALRSGSGPCEDFAQGEEA